LNFLSLNLQGRSQIFVNWFAKIKKAAEINVLAAFGFL
jgi:hypothetical protein